MRAIIEILGVVAIAVAGCSADRLDVSLGEPATVTAGASTGFDASPDQEGWYEGLPYYSAFGEFETVRVRFGGAIVVESGPASAGISVAADGTVYAVTINVEGSAPAEERDNLARGAYSALLGSGWEYSRGNSADVIGSVAPERWRRCLDGHSDDALSDRLPSPGSANLHAAHFERTSGTQTARVFNVFGCRLDGDTPIITHQLIVSLLKSD